MKTIILAPIAERDIHFYLKTADLLTKGPHQSNTKVVFFSFFQPGNDLIRKAGYPVYDPYHYQTQVQNKSLPISALESQFQVPDITAQCLHEKLTFGISDVETCLKKWRWMLPAFNLVLEKIENEHPASEKIVVQELAGFIAPLCLFYASMNRKWSHFFTEPAFFKGRIHLLKNNLYFKPQNSNPTPQSQEAVQEYLKTAFANKTVVAATKDAHHYKDMGVGKVFNKANFTRLTEKLINKYVRKQHYELDAIGNHVQRYLQMLINRWKNENHYSQLKDLNGKKLVYFPFHVQLDFSLTIRSPKWLDQLALIENIIEHLPSSVCLAAKEHPASIGCLDQTRLEKLLKNPRFFLMHPQINSYDILDLSSAVVTINSKVGAEAITKGLPTATFGKAFYTDEGFAHHFKSWEEFTSTLRNWTESKDLLPVEPLAKQNWENFLVQVWEQSFNTELYDLTPANVERFAQAIDKLS